MARERRKWKKSKGKKKW